MTDRKSPARRAARAPRKSRPRASEASDTTKWFRVLAGFALSALLFWWCFHIMSTGEVRHRGSIILFAKQPIIFSFYPLLTFASGCYFLFLAMSPETGKESTKGDE